MAYLTEEEVYSGTKKLLKSKGFILLGGQPPRGVNHIPVIEIKSGFNLEKGSRGSYKPDLVAFDNNFFYVIECKPNYCKEDIVKLNQVLSSEERLKSLYVELVQRNLIKKINWEGNFEIFKKSIRIAHAYSDKLVSEKGICHIVVENAAGEGRIVDLGESTET